VIVYTTGLNGGFRADVVNTPIPETGPARSGFAGQFPKSQHIAKNISCAFRYSPD